MGKSYSGPGFFDASYTVEDVTFSNSSWNDYLGSIMTKRAKNAPSNFNYQHQEIWERIGPLMKIDENAIEYESRSYDIERLKVDE